MFRLPTFFAAVLSCYTLLITLGGCVKPFVPTEEILAQLPERVDFNQHVKPLLSDRCFKCHGPDRNERKGDLRLDVPSGALEQGLSNGGYAFVPGKPHRSEAFVRMLSADPEWQMPPPESKLELSEYEIALIEKWIRQGAEYQKHWSLVSPRKGALPKIQRKEWVNNEVDYFILSTLENKGWEPSAEADRSTWLRRVSFDLTGLPPTLEELDDFSLDQSPRAYEKVVDRLLNSPEYGERMAVDWLDISRYADSHGYQDDGYRFVWPWRDWVVQSFNENMPYDRFISWQLAGDLLPEATQEQRLATTFLRNHRINSEAGIVGEEYRVEYVADRTNTLGSAILGLTLECARCHDHKYDPISQEDYYRLFAYFNNVNELGEIANDGNPGPLMMLTSDEVQKQIEWLEKVIEKEEISLRSGRKNMITSEPNLEQDLRKGLVTYYSFEGLSKAGLADLAKPGKVAKLTGNPSLVAGRFGNGLKLGEYDRVRIGEEGKFERTDAFSVSLWLHPTQKDAYTPIWGDPSNKNIDFKGFGMVLDSQRVAVRFIHALPHNHIHVVTKDSIPLREWTHIAVRYDGSSRAKGVEVFVNGQIQDLHVVHDNLYKGMLRREMVLGGGTPWGTLDGASFDEFRVYHRKLSTLEIQYLFDGDDHSSKGKPDLILAHERLHRDKTYATVQVRLDSLRKSLHQLVDTIQEIMVMEEMTSPRATFVLDRGVYDAPAERVFPGVPMILGSPPLDRTYNRLELTSWLTDPQHPLVARVAVNRFWKQLFGRGMVSTPMDFGNQGALPSHPQLLDWLAVDFIESGWDIKAILKKLVLSATYRQQSHISPNARTMDPENIFLARGPRLRLSAEMLRDNALATSGLLVRKMGGPPVKPYQPAGLWKELAPIGNRLSTYQQDSGSNLYRRSLYTIWKRTAPPPALVAFDAPTRELCQVERQETTTPLQSLVLWNDPQWLEAARMIGERMMKEAGTEPEKQIDLAFRLLTSRYPKAPERDRLLQYYEKQLANYRSNEEEAKKLLNKGDYKRDASLALTELAACSLVAHAIMNLDEAIVKY